MKALYNHNIVLIADPVTDHLKSDISNLDLECPTMEYFNAVKKALEKLSEEVICYSSPKELIHNIDKHIDDIVISIWSGKDSIYRKAFVSTICECYGIKYFGPDPYVQFLCQDKHLSKIYCKEFGIEGAKEARVKSKDDYDKLKKIKFPMIIKPNAEGGSNGITQENVVYTHEEATKLCDKLLPIFGHDLLAEEYLKGVEVTVVIAGNEPENLIIEQNRIVLENGIKNEIWGLESKKQEIIDVPIEITNIIDKETISKFVNLFSSFKKAELMRIDGRVYEGKFYLLELTPDVSIEPVSSSASAFSHAGFKYDEMFEVLLNNALDYYKKKK